jgi:hypothetical protein
MYFFHYTSSGSIVTSCSGSQSLVIRIDEVDVTTGMLRGMHTLRKHGYFLSCELVLGFFNDDLSTVMVKF